MAGSDMPGEIRQLAEQCEAGVRSFTNDQMSAALHFGETLWRRLGKVAEMYESMSGEFAEHDIRGSVVSQAAKIMRDVMADTAKDLRE